MGGQPTIDPNNGFVSQALGHRAALDLIHLHLPWWNPYEGTGTPLAGEMQSAALFPPRCSCSRPTDSLLEHVVLEILAGIATYLVLRRIACNRWAAFAGGAAFAVNGSFAWFAHAPVNPIAFLPLLLLGIERAYSATLEGAGATAAGAPGGARSPPGELHGLDDQQDHRQEQVAPEREHREPPPR